MRPIGVVVLAACAGSGGPSAAPPEARGPTSLPSRDAAVLAVTRHDAGVAAGAGVVDAASGGDGARLFVRVEWPAAPAAARLPRRAPDCLHAPSPPLRVHTLHGVADVVVLLDAADPRPAGGPTAPVRIDVDRCGARPAIAITGDGVVWHNADQVPHDLQVREAAMVPPLAASPSLGPVRGLALPVPGHQVSATLAPGHAWTWSDADTGAWVVRPPDGWRAALTDDAGAVEFGQVPPGTHQVEAWIAPWPGRPARVVRGTVEVVADARAELVLRVAP